MHKKVKNGIEKHYCDVCGKLLYDLVPKNKITATIFGIAIPEYGIKEYCKCKRDTKKEYCEKCYKEVCNENRKKRQNLHGERK